MRPALVIHAGAGRLPSTAASASRMRDALVFIADEAFARLKKGTSSAEAICWAVEQMENDPQFNAGTGAKLQSDGVARLTAALMEGSDRRFSGVMNIEGVKNPIAVARLLQTGADRVLAAEGAKQFARHARFEFHDPITEEAWKEWKQKSRVREEPKGIYGTVGAVAVDRRGRLASATSTGGKGMERVGRVSDTATVAGTYASSRAAVSATGIGEEIVEWALAARIVTRVDDGASLVEAFRKTFREFRRAQGRAGAIGIDAQGRVAVETTTPCILHVIRTPRERRGFP